jgi:AraC family transcriptional regulator
MKSSLVNPLNLNQYLNKSLLSSSRQMSWNGILVEQYQYTQTKSEFKLPALSTHCLILPLGHPIILTQKHSDAKHKWIVQKGDSIFIPAGQSTCWCCEGSETVTALYIYLQPKLFEQVAEASEIDIALISLVSDFVKQDLCMKNIAMLLLSELESGGVMGKLYVESLTQVLVIHLLRHYSTKAQIISSDNKTLTGAQLQQALDYIHTHLDEDLSIVQIAKVINISPTYFASLFKSTIGNSPHRYVIQQRVERAKMLLSKTDLEISDIALQVGFSSQSHLTQQFKRFTGMTPRQVRSSS